MAIQDYLCRFALESHLDTLQPPNHALDTHQLNLMGHSPSTCRSAVALQPETPSKLARVELLQLPIELISRILEEAAESTMMEECEAYLAIDILRPEKMSSNTISLYPSLTQRFNHVLKILSLVCRLFHGLSIPLIWRSPFFSPRSTKLQSFVNLLPSTTLIAPSPRLTAPKPFWTYVRVLTPWSSSIFYLRPDHLLVILPMLQSLETINFGTLSADVPIHYWEQICTHAPVSLRRLPDLHLDPNEVDSGRRMSYLLRLVSRCKAIETFDLVWGSSLRTQIDQFKLAIELSRFQPEGVRIGSALRSLDFNALCDIPVDFVICLPVLAPLLDSLHFEVGSRIVGEGLKDLDVDILLDQLRHLQTFSFTATLIGVRKIGTMTPIIQKLPRLTGLQIFVSDIDVLQTFKSLVSSKLSCLCLCAKDDVDLTRLVCIRRPWRIRQVTELVVELVGLVGGQVPSDEESVLDIFRKASASVEGDEPRIVFDWRW